MTDSLGARMKRYESASAFVLPQRMPVILRVDGRAFHTYTRSCARPFDEGIVTGMQEVGRALCEEVQGAQMAFVQSDEVSVLLHNYKSLQSDSWFDNKVQKMASVAAGIASGVMTLHSISIFEERRRACFDARVFVLPESDVVNYFVWRQQDWTRNSIQMLAHSLYSHKQLHGKNTAALQEMCFQKGVNWNDLPIHLRRGSCVVRRSYYVDGLDTLVERKRWEIDFEPPVFSQQWRYIEKHLATAEEPE